MNEQVQMIYLGVLANLKTRPFAKTWVGGVAEGP